MPSAVTRDQGKGRQRLATVSGVQQQASQTLVSDSHPSSEEIDAYCAVRAHLLDCAECAQEVARTVRQQMAETEAAGRKQARVTGGPEGRITRCIAEVVGRAARL